MDTIERMNKLEETTVKNIQTKEEGEKEWKRLERAQ